LGDGYRPRAGEITRVLRQRIEEFTSTLQVVDVGMVTSVGDGIARIYGLEGVMAGELLAFPRDIYGMALNLEEDGVGAVLFGSDILVREGDMVQRTKRVVQVPVGDELLGRVVNPLGEPLDGGGPIRTERFRPVEAVAPGVVERRPVDKPLQTGIKAIDALVPIGRGQRELIIGDRQTGKTALAVDAILNQRESGVICIYVAIGQKASTVAGLIQQLREGGVFDRTLVVSATASEVAPLQFLAPYAGCAMGEEFMYQGRDVLIVYDDLTKHAVAYRQLSLLLRRPPGREAFPGDVFYLHSRLLERAACLVHEKRGGTMTALPIVETQAGDISAYIPTNVISITDGQIYLEGELFFAGMRPAVNVGLSVSRVGGSAQLPAMRQVASRLRLDLAQYRELASFTQFAADVDRTTRMRLIRGERMMELLKQPQYNPMPVHKQVLVLYAGVNGYLDDLVKEDVARFQDEFLVFMGQKHPSVGEGILSSGDLTRENRELLDKALDEFKGLFIATRREAGNGS
jgi:F-type H+-transporting ATPase subunit alpha